MKYLVLDTTNCLPAGLDHKLSTLKHAIKEAVHLGRILVLRKFTIWPHQNYVHEQTTHRNLVDSIADNMQRCARSEYRSPSLNFEHYIDLHKSKIYKMGGDGSIHEIEKPLRYISEDDFDLNAYANDPRLVMNTSTMVNEFPHRDPTLINEHVLLMENNQPLSHEQNDQYPIVIRRTNAFSYYTGDFAVSFRPSHQVQSLTDKALNAMGTNLNAVTKRFAFYHNTPFTEIRNNYRIAYSRKYPLYYAALHVRANDAYYHPSIRYAADHHNLARIAKRAIPKNSLLYIMSDINDPHYFDFLKKDYTVYQYHDFTELKCLVSSDNKRTIDNAMLYSVEKNILQYACIKIVRAKRRPNLIYINSTHNIPWKYKLASIYDYLTSNILKRNPTDYTSFAQTIKHIKNSLRSKQKRH